jgi:hypothetical protein
MLRRRIFDCLVASTGIQLVEQQDEERAEE